MDRMVFRITKKARGLRGSTSGDIQSSGTLWESVPPLGGIAGRVEHPVNRYQSIGHFVKYGVGKATYLHTTTIREGDGVQIWIAQDSAERCIHAAQKLFAQSAAADFIPFIGLGHIGFGLRREDQIMRHGGDESAF